LNKYAIVYRKAAEVISEKEIDYYGYGYGCCAAIRKAIGLLGIWCDAIYRFEYFLYPIGNVKSVYWFGSFTKRNREARVFALLLMAEIAESEGWE